MIIIIDEERIFYFIGCIKVTLKAPASDAQTFMILITFQDYTLNSRDLNDEKFY